MSKNSFVLYYNYKDQLEDLTNEQMGELLRAIFDYEINGLVPEFNSLEAKVAFKFIKKDLDANREKYEEVCQKNRGNGQKGGRPKIQVVNAKTQNNRTVIAETQENQTVIRKTEQNPIKPKKPDNDNDNDIESKKVSNGRVRESYDEIIDANCSPTVADAMRRFIKHCLANKHVLINDTLFDTIVCLDQVYGTDERSKVESIKQAIEGGYFDIVEKLKLRQLRRSGK